MVGGVGAVWAGVLGNVAGPECMHACMDGLGDGMWEFGRVCHYIVLCCLMSIWLAFGRIGWMDGWPDAYQISMGIMKSFCSPCLFLSSHRLPFP